MTTAVEQRIRSLQNQLTQASLAEQRATSEAAREAAKNRKANISEALRNIRTQTGISPEQSLTTEAFAKKVGGIRGAEEVVGIESANVQRQIALTRQRARIEATRAKRYYIENPPEKQLTGIQKISYNIFEGGKLAGQRVSKFTVSEPQIVGRISSSKAVPSVFTTGKVEIQKSVVDYTPKTKTTYQGEGYSYQGKTYKTESQLKEAIRQKTESVITKQREKFAEQQQISSKVVQPFFYSVGGKPVSRKEYVEEKALALGSATGFQQQKIKKKEAEVISITKKEKGILGFLEEVPVIKDIYKQYKGTTYEQRLERATNPFVEFSTKKKDFGLLDVYGKTAVIGITGLEMGVREAMKGMERQPVVKEIKKAKEFYFGMAELGKEVKESKLGFSKEEPLGFLQKKQIKLTTKEKVAAALEPVYFLGGVGAAAAETTLVEAPITVPLGFGFGKIASMAGTKIAKSGSLLAKTTKAQTIKQAARGGLTGLFGIGFAGAVGYEVYKAPTETEKGKIIGKGIGEAIGFMAGEGVYREASKLFGARRTITGGYIQSKTIGKKGLKVGETKTAYTQLRELELKGTEGLSILGLTEKEALATPTIFKTSGVTYVKSEPVVKEVKLFTKKVTTEKSPFMERLLKRESTGSVRVKKAKGLTEIYEKEKITQAIGKPIYKNRGIKPLKEADRTDFNYAKVTEVILNKEGKVISQSEKLISKSSYEDMLKQKVPKGSKKEIKALSFMEQDQPFIRTRRPEKHLAYDEIYLRSTAERRGAAKADISGWTSSGRIFKMQVGVAAKTQAEAATTTPQLSYISGISRVNVLPEAARYKAGTPQQVFSQLTTDIGMIRKPMSFEYKTGLYTEKGYKALKKKAIGITPSQLSGKLSEFKYGFPEITFVEYTPKLQKSKFEIKRFDWIEEGKLKSSLSLVAEEAPKVTTRQKSTIEALNIKLEIGKLPSKERALMVLPKIPEEKTFGWGAKNIWKEQPSKKRSILTDLEKQQAKARVQARKGADEFFRTTQEQKIKPVVEVQQPEFNWERIMSQSTQLAQKSTGIMEYKIPSARQQTYPLTVLYTRQIQQAPTKEIIEYRTIPQMKYLTPQISKIKAIQKLKPEITSQTKIFTRLQPKIQTRTFAETRTFIQTRPQIKTQLRTFMETKIKSKTQTKTQAKTQTQLRIKTITKAKTKLKTPLELKSKIKIPPSTIKIPEARTKIYKKKSEAGALFGLEVKRRGKFKKIGKFEDIEKAFKTGKEKTKGTLAATFRLVPLNKKLTKKEEERLKRLLGTEFRTYKIRKGKKQELPLTFIQKRGYRLGTLGERKEIQKARKQSLLFGKTKGGKKANFFK